MPAATPSPSASSTMRPGRSDRIILDTARTDAYLQLPNDETQQAIGRDVTQREDGDFANLIWRHAQGLNGVTVALYSHQSRLRYTGDPAHDLSGASAASVDGGTPANLPSSAFEDRYANYIGLRTDAATRIAAEHKIGYGFDISTVTGSENFTLLNAVDNGNGTTGVQTVQDEHALSGGDRSAYLQDDWTPGRFLVNYGVRYDIHKTDTTTSQLSPRLNLTYTLSSRDKVHAYYDRLFQPAPIEDIRRLDPNAVPFKPERDNFYEVGYTHENGGITTSLSGYYKTEQDVIDENIIAGTQIREPFNVQKGYVRGIEFAVDGSLTRDLSFYANYARSWARAAGDFTGGLAPPGRRRATFTTTTTRPTRLRSVWLTRNTARRSTWTESMGRAFLTARAMPGCPTSTVSPPISSSTWNWGRRSGAGGLRCLRRTC